MAGELGVLTLDMVARTVNFDQPLMKSEKQAEVSSKNIASSFEKIEKQSESTSKAVAFMGSSLKASIAAISISSIVSIADGYTQTAARIQNATTSAAEYNLVQKHLYETANSTYRSLKEAQEVYLGTSGGLKELGYNTQAVLAISDSLSYSFVHNATSVDKAQSAMDAYGKILDKGKVEADAWFSLMVAAPNILTDVSNATGKSTQEIRKLGAEGKLAAEDLHKGLLLSRDANQALADSMVNSAADGSQKLSNAIARTVGELNRGTGATAVFADGLGLVADHIDVVSGGVVIAAAYMSGTYLSSMVASTAAGYAKSKQLMEQSVIQIAAVNAERQAAATALAQAQAQTVNTQATLAALSAERALEAERLKAQISAQGRAASLTRLAELGRIEAQVKRELTVATTAETAAQERSNIAKGASVKVGSSALAFLGGPAGLGITVATVAAGYLLMRDNAEKNTESLRENNGAVTDAIQKYRELSSIQRVDQLAAERKKLDDLNEEYRKSSTALMVYAANMKNMGDIVTESQVALSNLYSKYKENGNLEAFNNQVQSSSLISQDAKDKVANLASSVEKVGKDAQDQKAFIGQLNGELNNTKSAGANAASGINQVSNAAADASVSVDALKKALGTLSTQKTDALYVVGTSKNLKGDIEQAKAMLAFRKDLGLGSTGRSLNTDERANFDASWKAQQQLKSYEESIAQAKRKSLDVSKQQTKEIKQQAQDAKQQQKEAENNRKEILQNQYDISYRYADRTAKMESDLLKEQNEIRKAYASDPTASKMYLDAAKQRHTDALKLYDVQLGQELYSFKMNEEAKLILDKNLEHMRITKSSDYTDDEKKSRIKALNERHEHEMAWLNLEQLQRLNDAQSSFQSDIQRVTSKYEFEREQIRLTKAYSDDMKDALIGASYKVQDRENAEGRDSAWTNFQRAIGVDTSAEDEQRSRSEAIQAAYDWQLITQEDYQRKMLESEQRYFMAKAELGIASMQTTMGGWADVFKNLLGESSSYYQAAFAMERGFAVAKAMVNAPLVYTETYAALAGIPYIGPYIAQPAAIAAAGLQVVQAGIAGNVGFYDGGYTGDGGKYEYAGPAHKGEVVFSQDDIKRWGGVSNVEKMRTQRSIPTLSPKVGNGFAGREVNQKQASPNVNLNPNFVIVDQREKLGDYLYGPDGKKAFVKFFKQNRKELGLA